MTPDVHVTRHCGDEPPQQWRIYEHGRRYLQRDHDLLLDAHEARVQEEMQINEPVPACWLIISADHST